MKISANEVKMLQMFFCKRLQVYRRVLILPLNHSIYFCDNTTRQNLKK